jgi:hypothetical protein
LEKNNRVRLEKKNIQSGAERRRQTDSSAFASARARCLGKRVKK